VNCQLGTNYTHTGKVTWWKCELRGSVKGTADSNPIIDTRTYNIEFPDERCEEYMVNATDENVYDQCDEEGIQFLLLQDIRSQEGRPHIGMH
jgi:hypothetical protein